VLEYLGYQVAEMQEKIRNLEAQGKLAAEKVRVNVLHVQDGVLHLL
jgi:hypothetical protein